MPEVNGDHCINLVPFYKNPEIKSHIWDINEYFPFHSHAAVKDKEKVKRKEKKGKS